MTGPITGARLRALVVVSWRGSARVGMGMWTATEHDPVITPAGESWLLDMGYATSTEIEGRRGVSITDAGRDASRTAT